MNCGKGMCKGRNGETVARGGLGQKEERGARTGDWSASFVWAVRRARSPLPLPARTQHQQHVCDGVNE